MCMYISAVKKEQARTCDLAKAHMARSFFRAYRAVYTHVCTTYPQTLHMYMYCLQSVYVQTAAGLEEHICV